MFFLLLIHYFLFFSLTYPQNIWALQSHGGGEGFIVHQLGHLLFAVAMIGVVYIIRKKRDFIEQEWGYFSWGALFMFLWNIWAFIGHQIEITIPNSVFVISPDGTPSIKIDNVLTLLYYIYKMDHIILVPSMVFFLMGLKKLSGEKAKN